MAIEAAVNTTTTNGIAIANPGALNTKGAYTQLIASTTVTTTALAISAICIDNNNDYLIDIATGGAGAESVILSNLPGHQTSTNNNALTYGVLPISIASGTRVAARYQAGSITGDDVLLNAYFLGKDTVGFDECTSAVTYGADTSDSGGVQVDPGGAANTKGSYSEISASTSANIKWIMVGVGNRANTARSSCSWYVDIATGAAASESVVVPNLQFRGDVVSHCIHPQWSFPIPIVIASGTRIAARAQCTTTDATDRLLDIIVVGFDGTAGGGGGGSATHFSAAFSG
jgi:hypothetical protein